MWNLPGLRIEPISPALAGSYPVYHEGNPPIFLKNHFISVLFLAALVFTAAQATLVVVCWLLIGVAPLVAEHGL